MVVLVIASAIVNTGASSSASVESSKKIALGVNINKLVPETPKPDYEKEVLQPLKEAQRRDAEVKELARIEAERIEAERVEAERIAQEALQAQLAAQAVVYAPAPVQYATQALNSSLTGSYGHATVGGNCVQEPGVNNPGQGNPISWMTTSSVPWIGATALFTYNHVGVVTGIWSNGDLEIAHQNFTGGTTRFSISQFRGFR